MAPTRDTQSMTPRSLRGRVAVVAGATRGAGRGIAAGLGEAGATVICTGRSSVTGNESSDYRRPETIEQTAALVTKLGGTGLAIQVDHLDAAQVRGLARRLGAEFGAIDILVNDIWGAEVLKGPPSTWGRPLWEHDLDDGLRILRLGIDTHLITSHCLMPLLVARPGGLVVEITTLDLLDEIEEDAEVGLLPDRLPAYTFARDEVFGKDAALDDPTLERGDIAHVVDLAFLLEKQAPLRQGRGFI